MSDHRLMMTSTKREPKPGQSIPPYIATPVDHIPVVCRHYHNAFPVAQPTTVQVRTRLTNAFRTGRTKAIQFRKQQLLSLAYLVKDNLARFQQALASDLGRSDTETIV
jgi:tRNA pseudouridine-54 N-methylase